MTSREIDAPGVAFQPVARNRRVGWAVLSVSIAAAVALSFVVPSELFGLVVNVAGAGIFGGLWAVLRGYYGQPSAPGQRRMRPATLRVNDDAVTIDYAWVSQQRASGAIVHERRIDRVDIVEGWVDSFGGHHSAVLRMRSGDQVWIAQPTATAANELLATVGVGPEQQVVSARLASRAARTPGGVVAAWLTLIVSLPIFLAAVSGLVFVGHQPLIGIVVAAAMVVGVFKLLQALIPPRAIIGTDGIRIEGFAQKRFVSYADVARVDSDVLGVWLRRADGADLLLPTGPGRTTARSSGEASANTLAIHHRIEQAMAAGRTASLPQTKLEMLDRKGRTVADWLRDVSGLSRERGGYRQVFLDRDELLAVLLDSTATVERRIAAAAALTGGDDPEVRQRVRIAGDTCANERLRIAIDAAAGGELDEDAVELALEEAARAETSAA